ncbi:hypothetical protein E2C01_055164 [Portunus trituberculatus]|uniref:Uncharacterized protein n=1 Tax=Portunus trituberculatus TaxID=210409 RepID=A0A5B7GQG8_PORTR|nr:hypothetical protein [Portunus trituberculatus]
MATRFRPPPATGWPPPTLTQAASRHPHTLTTIATITPSSLLYHCTVSLLIHYILPIAPNHTLNTPPPLHHT